MGVYAHTAPSASDTPLSKLGALADVRLAQSGYIRYRGNLEDLLGARSAEMSIISCLLTR